MKEWQRIVAAILVGLVAIMAVEVVAVRIAQASYPTAAVMEWGGMSSFFPSGSSSMTTYLRVALSDYRYYQALMWTAATVGVAGLAVMGKIALCAGLIVGGTYLALKGWEYVDGQLLGNVAANDPFRYVPGAGATGVGLMYFYDTVPTPDRHHQVTGFAATVAEAQAACVAAGGINWSGLMGNAFGAWGTNWWGCRDLDVDGGTGHYWYHYWVVPYGSGAYLDESQQSGEGVPLTPGYVERTVAADLTASNDDAQTMVVAAAGALTQTVNDYLEDETEPPPPLTASDMAAVKNVLQGAIPAGTAATLQAKDKPATPATAAAEWVPSVETPASNSTVDKTANGVYLGEKAVDADRVKEAEDEDLGSNSVTPPTDPEPPEKKSWTAVAEAFVSGLAALPIVNWLTGITVTVPGGNSIITLPLPAAWGGSVTIDFATYESLLVFIGAALHAIVGIRWTIWLFE